MKNHMRTFQKIKTFFSFTGPARQLGWFVFISGVIWVIQTSLLQNILPLDAVESVVWGNQAQWGQMKSPPLAGWLAAAFWHLTGGSDWSIYLLAELMVLLSLWFVYKLAREFMDEYESATASLLLFFLFYYNPPAMKFCTHDTLLALLPAMTLFFVRAFKRDRLTDWILLALFSALAVLGKYSAIQLLIAYAVAAAVTKTGRKRLLSYKPYLCAGIFFLLISPHIYWLFQHDFLPILHMQNRLENDHEWYYPLENFATLLYPYFSCFVFLCAAGLIRNKRVLRNRDGLKQSLRLLLPVALIPPGIYVILSLCGGVVVGQWFSYFSYMSGIVAVLLWPYQCGRTEFRRLLAAAAVLMVVLLTATSVDVIVKPRLRIHSMPQDIVKAGELFWQRHSKDARPLTVAYGDRWLCGVMELYSSSAPAACDDDDICAWELHRDQVRKNGMLIIYRGEPPETLPLLPDVHTAKLKSATHVHKFRSLNGKSKESVFWFGYLPAQ